MRLLKLTLHVQAICLLATLIFPKLLLAQNTAQNHQEPKAWTLAAAIEYALSHHPDTRIAQYRLEQAQQATAIAQASQRPQLDASAEYSQTNTPMYSFGNILNQGAFDSSIDFNDPGRTDALNLKLSGQYSLYDGGRTRAQINSGRAQTLAANEHIHAVRQNLIFAVIKAFHGIEQAKEMVKTREAALASISASYQVGKARHDSGDLLPQDLLNLELQQARVHEELVRSRHELQLNQQIFANLLSLSDDQIGISDDQAPPQEPPRQRNIVNRPEIKAIDAIIAAAQADLAAAQSISLPTVGAFAQYQLESGTVLEESGSSWLAGVKLNYSLYNGQRTEAGIAKARARLFELQAEREKLQLTVTLDIQKAENALSQAKEQLQVTEKMVVVATESTRLNRLRFQEGLILAAALIEMEMRLTDAQFKHINAKAEYRVALANLYKATGTDQFSPDTAGTKERLP